MAHTVHCLSNCTGHKFGMKDSYLVLENYMQLD